MGTGDALYWDGIDNGIPCLDNFCLESNKKTMNASNPAMIVLSSMMVTVLALKLKDSCYWCFLGLFSAGLILFIFGIIKYLRQRNG